MTIDELEVLSEAGHFPVGSMGPKIEAAVHFLNHGGLSATICASEDLVDAFDGKAGTTIRANAPGDEAK